MIQPIYKDCCAKKQFDSHAGLWFERFFNKYNDDWTVPKDDSGKLAWIKAVTGVVGGDGKAVKLASTRQRELVDALGGTSFVAETDWHFATGLGNNHPVENGFAWHPTLGVPYLTGAAVKGLLRAWCEQWADFKTEELRTQAVRVWFGGDEKNPAAGELIFFDAIPIGPVKLKADVMTPHMGNWYENGGDKLGQDGTVVPADWHSPVPVPFLVVDHGQSFQFAVAKRAASQINLDEVKTQLIEALKHLGAGAKTAAGYGRMQLDQDAENKALKQKLVLEKLAQQKSMSPLERELDVWRSLKPVVAEAQTSKWLASLTTAPVELRPTIAVALKELFSKLGNWTGNLKEKQQLKVRQVKDVLGE
jgi:CRISPR-associated protein Cmr6